MGLAWATVLQAATTGSTGLSFLLAAKLPSALSPLSSTHLKGTWRPHLHEPLRGYRVGKSKVWICVDPSCWPLRVGFYRLS